MNMAGILVRFFGQSSAEDGDAFCLTSLMNVELAIELVENVSVRPQKSPS